MFQAQKLVSLIRFGEDEVPPIDFNALADNPAFKEFLTAAVSKETEGLRTKADQLLGEKKKAQDALRKFESGIQEEEDLKALKAGQLDFQTLLDKRVGAANKDWQDRLSAKDQEAEDLRKAISDRELKLQDFQIRSQVAQVALQNEFFQQSALDDLMHAAGQTWKLSDNGGLVARDGSGNIMLGKNGAPITPAEWVQGLTSTKPHYFKNMPGTGARGGQSGAKVVSLKNWQASLVTASPEERKALLAKRSNGEIEIQH
ncbi:hypothetical protein [Pseudomonas shirazensis]|uniref:hypothetical protein n=1 Tax=Pseudomonas shirazensis TaxID=2745494 RepID=UPI003D27F264